jgi:hypothetical protein
MKNRLLWIVLAVVLLGGGYWFMTQSSDNSATGNQQTNTNGNTQTTSIKKLMAEGRPVTCKFADADTKTQGTVYLSGEKMLGEFSADGKSSHMINDGQFVYIWSDDMPQGVKMAATAFSGSAAGSMDASAPDLESDQDLDCSSWSASASSFVPPANITFSALPTGMGY